MKKLSVSPERPVDRVIVEVLTAIDRAARELGIGYFVAGAMARDLVLHHVFAFDTIRATSDIDIAVHVSDWDQFDSLTQRLIDSQGFSVDLRSAQRLYYLSAFPVDLVPFGGVVESNGHISWPPDRAFAMNVTGYDDALGRTLDIEVTSDLLVPVASLAGLATLKIIAWLDRGQMNPKDAQDLALLLRRYAETIDPDDLHGNEAKILEAVDYDYERAGARILGQDTRQLASPATADLMLNHLRHQPTRNRLVINMAQALRQGDDPVEKADLLIEEFLTGLS